VPANPVSAIIERHSPTHPLKIHTRKRGFTLVELLIVIAIIVALTAIAVPIYRSLLTRSHAVKCFNNLRQIGLATMMYAGDNNMTLPVTSHQRRAGGVSWTISLQPYASGTIAFKCAQDEDAVRPYTYLINDYLTPNPSGAPQLDFSRLAKIERPSATLLFAEASASYKNTDHFHFSPYHGGVVPFSEFASQVAIECHGDKANYLFTDGHVESLTKKEVQSLLESPGSRFLDPSDPETTTE